MKAEIIMIIIELGVKSVVVTHGECQIQVIC